MRRAYPVDDLCSASIEDVLDRDKFTFEMFPLRYANAVDIPVGIDDELFVLDRTYFDGRFCMTRGEVVGLDVFSSMLPVTLAKTEREVKPRKSPVPKPVAGSKDAFLAQYPWLSEADLDIALGKKRGISHAPSVSAKRKRGQSHVPCDDHERPSDCESELAPSDGCGEPSVPLFQAEDLEQLRSIEAVDEHRSSGFYARMRCGSWYIGHKGEVADSASYFARGGSASEWCRLFQFPKQEGFVYNKFGGRAGPHICANEVARKAQFFFDIWATAAKGKFVYTPEALASYNDGDEFREWADSFGLSSVCLKAAASVRELLPTNP